MPKTIGAAAEAAGVHVETIRYYERRGLIERPPRSANGGYRRYPVATIRRIGFIRRAQGLGFSLREIELLLGLRADPAAGCDKIRAQAVARLEQIDGLLSDLTRKRLALASVIEACPGKGSALRCAILRALDA